MIIKDKTANQKFILSPFGSLIVAIDTLNPGNSKNIATGAAWNVAVDLAQQDLNPSRLLIGNQSIFQIDDSSCIVTYVQWQTTPTAELTIHGYGGVAVTGLSLTPHSLTSIPQTDVFLALLRKEAQCKYKIN